MSNYQIFGCGMPSKPRAAEPSMFEILSWPGDKELSESKFEQPQNKNIHQECIKQQQLNQEQKVQNLGSQTNQVTQVLKNHPKNLGKQSHIQKKIVEQTYREHKSPLRQQKQLKQTLINQLQQSLENKTKQFIMSKIHQKQIKHQLFSYEPVYLKASRSKSAVPIKKDEKVPQNIPQKQEPQLDQKTIQQRKQKIKQFQIFTRALPNSAFTTYYGKPAFEAYGRGTSGKNLKSYNIMPHKGDNHPKNIESHYTALMKARDIKSKSHLPRKPVQENTVQSEHQHEDVQLKNINFPLQKPDLIKSKRFATIRPETVKKAGPPIMHKSTVNGIKRNTTEPKQSKKVEKKQKKNKQKKTNDGLKYMNERENLIDLLEEKKVRASQLAYKVTQCYPAQLQIPDLTQSVVSKQNWSLIKPAGKPTVRCDHVSDLLNSKLILQEKTNKVK